MIIVWVAIMGILTIENLVLSYNAYVFVWYSSAWALAMISALVWIMIGYGIKWMSSWNKKNIDENYDF